jgi:hypothetical protein
MMKPFLVPNHNLPPCHLGDELSGMVAVILHILMFLNTLTIVVPTVLSRNVSDLADPLFETVPHPPYLVHLREQVLSGDEART